jgi:methyltransferase (TIGR00027 family)
MLQNERPIGCGQYILFASGYDTYSVRNKENDLRVFELDLPVMIEDKKARIEKAGLVSDTVYVPCDLSKSGWEEELVRIGFKTTIKSFGSLLGITYYLEKKDFEILLRRIGSLMVQGSAICFDYQTAEESTVTKKNEELAAGAGEQMKAAYSLDECDESQTYYAGSGRRQIHPCCKGE